MNLIGDHTDYAGGLALAMAIDMATRARYEPDETSVLHVTSDAGEEAFDLGATQRHSTTTAAMLSGLLDGIGPRGGRLDLESTLPLGAGLSSSASMLVAAALALGTTARGIDLARLCQRAEAAAGQSVGLLDQLTIIEATHGAALLIDFRSYATTQVPVPDDAEITVVHSGVQRSLAAGAYAERRQQVALAEALIGPLPLADSAAVASIEDPTLARRARHVVEECDRVRRAAVALKDGALDVVGELMDESHASLATLFDVSTPVVDALVEEIHATPGVFGARMTGGGFGGCVVVLSERGALRGRGWRSWVVRPCDGAQVTA